MKLKKLVLASGVGLLASMSTLTYAVTPAGTIKNTAQLNYAGLSTPLEATVDVTVALVPAIPNFTNLTADQSVSSNAAVSYTYQITSTANGPETYSLTASDAVAGGLTGNSASSVVGSVVLGSTSAVSLAAIGVAVIKVPDDFVGGPATVNGLVAGDTVVIGGSEYTIGTITQETGDALAGLLTITLTANLTTAVASGDQIFERQDITVSIADVGGPDGTITTSVKATAPVAGDTLDVDAVTTVTSPAFDKWVRNVTNDNNTGGTSTTTCGTNPAITYYASDAGVTAVGTDVLEYCIQATPASDVTGATITDTIPPYTTYATGVQFGGSTAAVTQVGLAAGVLIQSASGGAAGEVDSGESAGVVFSVTVDN